MARIPNIYEQVFEAGDVITGAAYTGTAATVQSADGHVYRQTKAVSDGAIVGGEIPSEATGGDSLYRKITAVYVFAEDATEIRVIAVDPDGYEFVAYSTTSGNCLIIPEGDYYPVLPGWSVKVEADTSNGSNALGAGGGKIMFVLDPWFQPAAFNMS